MRWMPNIPFSSSYHAPKGPQSSSAVEIEINAGKKSGQANLIRSVTGVVGTSWPFSQAKRLASYRKDRHISDDNDLPDRKTQSECADDDICSNMSHSPSGYDLSFGRQSLSSACSSPNAAVSPQPLPLPELVKKDGIDMRPPSPSRSKTAKVVDEREIPVDGVSNGATPSILIKSVFTNQDFARRKMDSAETTSSVGRGQFEMSSSEASRNNFWINIPTRSAPCSPPSLSPQGRMNFDVLPYFTIPKSNQVWSAPEMPASDMMAGLPPPAFFDLGPFSPDSSPVNSPRAITSPSQCPKCLSCASSPVHSRVSPATTPTRRESNSPAIVHPLPLPPPGSSLFSPVPSMPSPTSSQATRKLDALSMKSQWQKGKLIGRGTFGSVYVATNRETGALCAMKEVELFPDDPKSAECIKQLQQEIKVLSHLKHPNIVQYYGSEIVEDRFYIYLEYVHPGSINKYVREHCGAVTEAVVRSFTRHILSGLAYLHSTKTIHRDIKGANLLVDSAGVVKLADFGMAKRLNGQVADLSLRGSPYWMAPELMQAVMEKDKSSELAFALDIWSLGCTIIEMFTGKPPWSEYEGAAAMFKLMRDTPPIPETLSSEGKDFLNCCFIRNPAARPTAAALLDHRFLKTSHLDTPSSCHPHGADLPPIPKDLYDNRSDQLPVHDRHLSKEKVASDS